MHLTTELNHFSIFLWIGMTGTQFEQHINTSDSVPGIACRSNLWFRSIAISNYTKCILCNTETEEFKQIGNQPRDGKFGACFVCDIDGSDNESEDMIPNNATMMPTTSMRSPPSKTRIFCARPGARMWECDLDGNVIQTHKFKVALKSCRYASILNPSAPPPIPPNVQTLDQLIDLQSIRKRYIFGHTATSIFFFVSDKNMACALHVIFMKVKASIRHSHSN